MSEEKQPTEAEIKEQLEKSREVALKYLDSGLWDYAIQKLITPEAFGKLSKVAEEQYVQTLEKAPSQDVYDAVWKPEILKKGGAVTSPYIQETSTAILQSSFFSLKVEDILKYGGSKMNIDEKYKDMYVSQLDEKEAQGLVGMCMSYKTLEKVDDLTSVSRKNITSGLEEILAEKPKEELK